MKKIHQIFAISLLNAALYNTACAAPKSGNIGVNISFDNTVGIAGEFNLQKPVSLQVFLKQYARSYYYGKQPAYYNYSYTAIGAAVLYDFSKEFLIPNDKIHPYGGLGLYAVNANFNGTGVVDPAPANGGGIYFTFGARYEITPEIDFDGNFNNFGGLTLGANFKF